MKLKSFEIKSYRSCIKTGFPLHPELTGLIGVNSAGKSNILNALLLLRKICQNRYMPTQETDSSFNQCSIAIEIQHENKTLYMKGEITFEIDERNFDKIRYTELKWNLREFTDKAEWLSIPIEFIVVWKTFHTYQLICAKNAINLSEKDATIFRNLSQENHQLLSEVVLFFKGINYYSASQFSDPSQCPVAIEIEEQRLLKRVRSFAGVDHEQFISDLYKSCKTQDTQFKRYLNTVNKEGLGLIDGLDFTETELPSTSYNVQSGGKIKKIERNRRLIVPIFSIDGNKLSPNQLSEGTFKTLALLFYVLADEGSLLLIEEPEVCIHHGLLSSIISLIKTQSKQKQIVISTHSDFVLDQLTPENLVLVKRQTNDGTTAKPLSKSMSKNNYKVLREYLEESGNLGEYWKEGGFEDE
ncbi:MAG: AAA family ATPase [Candidatus Desantisbacteria bacterium]